MAKKKKSIPVPKLSFKKADLKLPLMNMPEQQKHHTFSHIMYVLFLISVTFAMYYTFQAFQMLGTMANPENFYVVLGILMLLWSFLFWEFGHRINQ